MKLTDFESEIAEDLLQKGFDYYSNGQVSELVKISAAHWIAKVEGTEIYEVEVQLHKLTIRDWQCNCPYDYGPICKHVVALFYALAKEKDQDQARDSSKPRKAIKDNVAEVFKKATKEDLQNFITEQFESERTLKNAFLAFFAELLDEDPDKKYRSIIKNLHKAATDRHGYVNYYSATKLARPLHDLAEKAEYFLAQKNLTEALAICQALVEMISDFLYDIDDSDGYLGEVVDSAFDTLHSLALEAPPPLKDQLFDYCLDEYPKDLYHGFGLEGNFLDILQVVIQTEAQEQEFFGLLDEQIDKEKKKEYGEYKLVSLILNKISYLLSDDRFEEANAFIDENLRYPDVRKIKLKQAIDKKEYETAKELCHQGIEIARKDDQPGTENDWREKLLEIALLQEDIPEIRRLAEAQYFSNYQDMKYYRLFKSTYPEEEWPQRCEALIDRIKGKSARGGFQDVNSLADIFIEEGYTDRLLKLLQLNPGHISIVDAYAGFLQDIYPEETLILYAEAVDNLAQGTGRLIYNEVARHLNTMLKISGGPEMVKHIVTDYRQRYKMRRAMMEVLGKF